MRRPVAFALALASIVSPYLLVSGALAGLPDGVRLALAFAALVLLPGHALLAATRALPPGGPWLASGWALGFGVLWMGLQVLLTRMAGVPFTLLSPWAGATAALPWALALWRAREDDSNEPVLSRAALVAVLLAAFVAAVHCARLGTPVSYYTDSPDHIGTVRRMLASGDAFPTDAFFRDAGGAGADPRKGLWHPIVALIAKSAAVDPLAAWRLLAALLAPLFVLNAAAFAFELGGSAAAAVGAWALLLTYGGSLAAPYLREAVFATKLADQLALATATAVFADLRRRSATSRIAAVGLALGAAAAHVFAAMQFAVVFGAMWVGTVVRDAFALARREAPVRHRARARAFVPAVPALARAAVVRAEQRHPHRAAGAAHAVGRRHDRVVRRALGLARHRVAAVSAVVVGVVAAGEAPTRALPAHDVARRRDPHVLPARRRDPAPEARLPHDAVRVASAARRCDRVRRHRVLARDALGASRLARARCRLARRCRVPRPPAAARRDARARTSARRPRGAVPHERSPLGRCAAMDGPRAAGRVGRAFGPGDVVLDPDDDAALGRDARGPAQLAERLARPHAHPRRARRARSVRDVGAHARGDAALGRDRDRAQRALRRDPAARLLGALARVVCACPRLASTAGRRVRTRVRHGRLRRLCIRPAVLDTLSAPARPRARSCTRSIPRATRCAPRWGRNCPNWSARRSSRPPCARAIRSR
ncbi:MAG: hypothetical protein IPJ04_02045 [Candidatus Eisenbacteria bacterium]|nr:hypothetical protein [Candidatus Eisenbacteria bacterium]